MLINDDAVNKEAVDFMDAYYPGWYCSNSRCGHYRAKDSEGDAWCWLRHGIGAEGREAECPAYLRHLRLNTVPNK